MIKAGAAHITSVDASEAYHAATRSVARELGRESDWTSINDDFVACAAAVAPADTVTLDKVICCYPDMPRLVGASAAKAMKHYAIVVPKDGWWVRAAAEVGNFLLRLLRFEFQGFVHPLASIDTVLEQAGLRMTAADSYWLWSVRLYARAA